MCRYRNQVLQKPMPLLWVPHGITQFLGFFRTKNHRELPSGLANAYLAGLPRDFAGDKRSCLGSLVFEATIPRNVRLSEAPSHGLPALIYDHACAGSRAYMALARELIGRLPERRIAA